MSFDFSYIPGDAVVQAGRLRSVGCRVQWRQCRGGGTPSGWFLGVFLSFFCLLQAALPPNSIAAEAPAPTTLKGLILHASPETILKEGDPALQVLGLQFFGGGRLQSQDLKVRLEPFLEQVLDEALLRKIQVEILTNYRKQGYPLVDVVLPPQTVTGGVLQVLVIESKLGKIVFEGTNKWTNTEYIRRNLHLEEGGPVHEKTLTSDLNWLNRSKFRTLDLYYKPGEAQFESDLVVRTSERLPLGGSVGINNHGNRLTGGGLLSAGVEWAHPVGPQDHSISYRYLSDLDLEFLKVHLASYRIEFPWHHSLTLSGSYSKVRSDVGTSLINQEGTSYGGSLRYEIQLPQLGNYRHLASVGAGLYRSDNNLEFNLISVLADTTDSFETSLGYTGILPDAWGNTFAGVEYNYSPGDVTSQNTDALFDTSYPFAEANYMYARMNLERITRLPWEFSWRASGSYQVSDGNLLPGPQMGLGGAYTIRGYEERFVSGSEGFMVINELRLPSFSPGGWLDRTARDEMQILGFFYYGETSNPKLQPGEDPHRVLMSSGVGMRYQVSRFLSVRFDYGWQLTDPNRGLSLGRKVPDSRGHISAVFSF